MTNINLRKLEYSPRENPFLTQGSEIRTRHKTVKTRTARLLAKWLQCP